LGDFLFAPARARSPVKSLSGGEKNRLLLARLFTKPANLIVMDEPTNDLDLETLELLETKLVEFDGTLLLVSHDRAFLDNVVTNVFALDGTGNVEEFVGGYSDWLTYHETMQASAPVVKKAAQPKADKLAPVSLGDKKKKLSFKEQQELSKLPELIAELEATQVQLTAQINDPDFYKQPQQIVNDALAKLQSIEQDITQSYARWDELEANS
jgi:ATP-binding cassette subfamily F protein uup